MSVPWSRVAVGDLLAHPLRNGISPSNKGTVTAEVLTLSAITGSRFDPNARKTAKFESEHAQEKTVCSADLLICRGNGNIGLVGRARRPRADMPDVAFPDTMIGASFDLDRVDLTFLEYLWDSRVVRGQVEESARSTNGTHKINQGMVESIEIPLPPIEEQRRIAAVLDAADELRAKRHEALAKLDTLTQAIFIDMFGDVFDPRQEDRETVALGELMAKRRGSVDPRGAPETMFDLYSIPAYAAGESELVRGADIGSSKPRVEPGDVLLSRIVPHIRRCWVVGESRGHPQVGSGEWIIFRQEGVVPSFLRAALLSDTFHPRFLQTVAGVGGSLLRARPAHVAEIRLGLPTRDQQAEFAGRADAVTRSTAVAAEAARQLDSLFASLQQRAFRGEL